MIDRLLPDDLLATVVDMLPCCDLLPAALSYRRLGVACAVRADSGPKTGPRWITAATTSLARIDWAATHFTHFDEEKIIPLSWCCALARRGDEQLLIYTLSGIRWVPPDLEFDGHLLCAAAAAGGHVTLLYWLHFKEGVDWDDGVLVAAAAGGHLSVFQSVAHEILDFTNLKETTTKASYRAIHSAAVRHGHVPILEWLFLGHLEDRPPIFLGKWSWKLAAQFGQIGVLQWLKSLKWGGEDAGSIPAFYHSILFRAAAVGGQLATLKWLLAEGCLWHEEDCLVCQYASAFADLEVLKWLRSPERDIMCPWVQSDCHSSALILGNDDVAAWIAEFHCSFDSDDCAVD